MKFITYNVISYLVYIGIDKIFLFFGWITKDIFDSKNMTALAILIVLDLIISFFLYEKAIEILDLD